VIPFGVEPAGRVEPTIGPSGRPPMESITGAGTLQPPSVFRENAEQGTGIFRAKLGVIPVSTRETAIRL